MVSGHQALSYHCRQAVAKACLVTLGSLQKTCLPSTGSRCRLSSAKVWLGHWFGKWEHFGSFIFINFRTCKSLSISLINNNGERNFIEWFSYFWLTIWCLKTATHFLIACVSVVVRQREIIQDVSFTLVTASSSLTSTGDWAPTADTDEESNIIKVHQMFTCISLPHQIAW